MDRHTPRTFDMTLPVFKFLAHIDQLDIPAAIAGEQCFQCMGRDFVDTPKGPPPWYAHNLILGQSRNAK
jgi:hypothetical protein